MTDRNNQEFIANVITRISNRPRLMAYALAIAAVTAPIMTPTRKK